MILIIELSVSGEVLFAWC